MITRQGFVQRFASLIAAPAVIRVTTIMPVKSVALSDIFRQIDEGRVKKEQK